MKKIIFLTAAIALIACGKNETVASKSARAYEEAVAAGKGIDGGHDHGDAAAGGAVDHSQHGAAQTETPAATHDHATMGAADHASHGGVSAATHEGHAQAGGDHDAHATTTHSMHARAGHAASGGSSGHTRHSTKVTDHSGHGVPSTPHATHSRGSTSAAHAGHVAGTTDAQRAHTAASGHAGHSSSPSPAAAVPHDATTVDHSAHGARAAQLSSGSMPQPPRTARELGALSPSNTLKQDSFDTPAPISVSEAQKASGSGHGSHGTTASDSAVQHEHSSGEAGSASPVVYTCPMHAEVISATPGRCPKCGMNLVKKEKK